MKQLFFLFLICLSNICIAQEQTGIFFPESYFGIYKGELHISTDKYNRKIPMEFHLLETDSAKKYQYTIVYGEEDKKQAREYILIEKDREKGHYILDENNGIMLHARVVENRIYFLFEVMNSILTTFITFGEDHLLFEIIATQTENKVISGGTSEELPEVISYPINVVQRAILQKEKSP